MILHRRQAYPQIQMAAHWAAILLQLVLIDIPMTIGYCFVLHEFKFFSFRKY